MSGPDCAVFCVHRPICCSVLKNVTTYPPPHNPHISEILTQLKKYTHTPPPPPPPPKGNDILAQPTESSENLGKVPKPTELARPELPPRDIQGMQQEGIGRGIGQKVSG